MRSTSGCWLAAGVLALVGLALRVPRLTQSIWFDEAFRTFVVMKPDVIRSLLLHDVHNPLYNAFMYGWIRVFGDSEVSIRVPTLLAGTGMIVIVWRWLRERFGPMQAWWAAAFLTVNPVHIWYSCEAKNNMFTVLFVTLTLWRLDVLARTLTARDVAFTAIAGALAIWTDFQSLLVLPAVWIAWCVVQARDKQRQRSWMVPLTAAAGSLVLVSPLLLFKAQRLEDLDREYLTYFHWYEPLRMLLVYFPTGNALVPTVRATWPFAALGFAPFVVLGLARGMGVLRGSAWGCVVLLVPMLIMWAASEALVQMGSSVRIFQDRNVLVMLPAVAMTLAVGAFAVRTRVGIVLARWGVLVLALASSLALVTVHRNERTVMHPNSHWRQSAAWLAEPSRDHALPIVSRAPLQPLEYYLPGRAITHLPTHTPIEETLPVFLRERAGEFYFIQHASQGALGEESLAWLNAQYETLEEHNVLHVTVRRMRVRSAPLPTD
jgi:mannosyltransferase